MLIIVLLKLPSVLIEAVNFSPVTLYRRRVRAWTILGQSPGVCSDQLAAPFDVAIQSVDLLLYLSTSIWQPLLGKQHSLQESRRNKREPPWVTEGNRIPVSVGVRISSAFQPDRITLYIPPRLRIVVPEVVVAEPRFLVKAWR